MSKETWLAEFYPTEADECPKADAVEHSLRKWVGLLPQNLKKHDVRIVGRSVFTPSHELVLAPDMENCSLCVHYYGDLDEPDEHARECSRCPLSQARDHVPCDEHRDDEALSGHSSSKAPWFAWTEDGDPKPMIKWLRRAKKFA